MGALAAHRLAHRGLPALAWGSVLALTATLGIVVLASPRVAAPVYRGWMALGHAIGRITTPVLLGLVFFLVFLPVRLALLLLRKDALGARQDANAATYWVTRDRPDWEREDFERLS